MLSNTKIIDQFIIFCYSIQHPEHEIQNLILIGDFNVNIENESPKLTLLSNLCKQFRLKIKAL